MPLLCEMGSSSGNSAVQLRPQDNGQSCYLVTCVPGQLCVTVLHGVEGKPEQRQMRSQPPGSLQSDPGGRCQPGNHTCWDYLDSNREDI